MVKNHWKFKLKTNIHLRTNFVNSVPRASRGSTTYRSQYAIRTLTFRHITAVESWTSFNLFRMSELLLTSWTRWWVSKNMFWVKWASIHFVQWTRWKLNPWPPYRRRVRYPHNHCEVAALFELETYCIIVFWCLVARMSEIEVEQRKNMTFLVNLSK